MTLKVKKNRTLQSLSELLFTSLACIFIISCATKNEDKERASLFLQRGLNYYTKGDIPNAIKDLQKASEYDANDPVIHNNLGLAYYERERPDLALKHLKKAVSLNGKYTEARNNLARVFIDLEKYSEAEVQLNIILQDLTYGGTEKAYFNLGLSKFNQGQFSGALPYFNKSLKLQRENCAALTYVGRSYFELKNYNSAAEALDKAVGFCQKVLFDEPQYFSALTYFRLGERDKSITRFEELIKLYPNGKYREKSKAMLDLTRKVN